MPDKNPYLVYEMRCLACGSTIQQIDSTDLLRYYADQHASSHPDPHIEFRIERWPPTPWKRL
jgi:hypothetical protein